MVFVSRNPKYVLIATCNPRVKTVIKAMKKKEEEEEERSINLISPRAKPARKVTFIKCRLFAECVRGTQRVHLSRIRIYQLARAEFTKLTSY